MQVHFIHPRKIQGFTYQKGLNEVPDKASEDWFFKACLKDGSVAVMTKAEPVAAPKAAQAPAQQAKGK